jgi:glycosyltransferase involved in cell wall biosynthesis
MSHTEPVSKTRVLYIVESFSTGVYAIIRDIATGLDPEKFELHIIHSLRPDSPKDYEKDLSFSHITLEYIPMDRASRFYKAFKAIRERMKRFKPDVIHLHSSKGGFIGSLAAKGHKRLFYSPHGFAFLRTDVGGLKRTIFFLAERWIRRFAGGTIIAVSKGELEEASRVGRKAVAINNFIDVRKLPERFSTDQIQVVTTGRINYQKNPQLFNTVAEQLPDIQFIWVGDGPLRSVLTSPNITVTGYLSRTEALAQVAGATLYIQTSKWEGMPVSVLEAMAIGLPIVATDIIGNRDLITHDRDGLLCDIGDTGAFVNAVRHLLQDQEQAQRLGLQAREKITGSFNIDGAIAQYEHLYRHGYL